MLFLIFAGLVGCFALFPKRMQKLWDDAPTVVGILVAIGMIGWVVGPILQILKYGAVTAPYS